MLLVAIKSLSLQMRPRNLFTQWRKGKHDHPTVKTQCTNLLEHCLVINSIVYSHYLNTIYQHTLRKFYLSLDRLRVRRHQVFWLHGRLFSTHHLPPESLVTHPFHPKRQMMSNYNCPRNNSVWTRKWTILGLWKFKVEMLTAPYWRLPCDHFCLPDLNLFR